MPEETISRYDDMLDHLGDFFASTVTIPDSGTLTIDDAVQRLGFAPTAVQGPDEPHSGGGIRLYQAARGIVTLDWTNPGSGSRQMTDQLAGEGFRHRYLALDIEGNTGMYVRHGDAEGFLEHPEPVDIPLAHWYQTAPRQPHPGRADRPRRRPPQPPPAKGTMKEAPPSTRRRGSA